MRWMKWYDKRLDKRCYRYLRWVTFWVAWLMIDNNRNSLHFIPSWVEWNMEMAFPTTGLQGSSPTYVLLQVNLFLPWSKSNTLIFDLWIKFGMLKFVFTNVQNSPCFWLSHQDPLSASSFHGTFFNHHISYSGTQWLQIIFLTINSLIISLWGVYIACHHCIGFSSHKFH